MSSAVPHSNADSDEFSLLQSDDENEGCSLRPVELTPELVAGIVKQVEFYFSDANLATDKKLLKQIRKNGSGFVPVRLFANYRRVRAWTKNLAAITAALHFSALLKLSDDGKMVRRVNPVPDYDVEGIQRRTVVVEHLPSNPTIGSVTEMFSVYGKVNLVRICSKETRGKLPNWLTATTHSLHHQHAFVEFCDADSAVMAVAALHEDDGWGTTVTARHLLVAPSDKNGNITPMPVRAHVHRVPAGVVPSPRPYGPSQGGTHTARSSVDGRFFSDHRLTPDVTSPPWTSRTMPRRSVDEPRLCLSPTAPPPPPPPPGARPPYLKSRSDNYSMSPTCPLTQPYSPPHARAGSPPMQMFGPDTACLVDVVPVSPTCSVMCHIAMSDEGGGEGCKMGRVSDAADAIDTWTAADRRPHLPAVEGAVDGVASIAVELPWFRTALKERILSDVDGFLDDLLQLPASTAATVGVVSTTVAAGSNASPASHGCVGGALAAVAEKGSRYNARGHGRGPAAEAAATAARQFRSDGGISHLPVVTCESRWQSYDDDLSSLLAQPPPPPPPAGVPEVTSRRRLHNSECGHGPFRLSGDNTPAIVAAAVAAATTATTPVRSTDLLDAARGNNAQRYGRGGGKKDYASWAAATPEFRAVATAASAGRQHNKPSPRSGPVQRPVACSSQRSSFDVGMGQGVEQGSVHVARGPDGGRGFQGRCAFGVVY